MNAVIAVCIAVLAVIPATALAQGTVETMQLRGTAAFAEWRYVEGDVVTEIAAVVSEDRRVTGGTGGSSTTWSPFASISIFRANAVTGAVFISGVGQSENFEFSVAGDLSSAVVRLETFFQDDSSFTFFNLFVDLRWDATGPRQTDVDHVVEIDIGEGFVYRQVSNGAHRPAVATGSILGQFTDAEGNVIREEEFLRGPSFSGEIQSNKNASLQIVYP
jgi:hypothetical protein